MLKAQYKTTFDLDREASEKKRIVNEASVFYFLGQRDKFDKKSIFKEDCECGEGKNNWKL